PSKKQPLPGLKIISRALEKLQIITDAYLIFCQRTRLLVLWVIDRFMGFSGFYGIPVLSMP
ncbi:MAG: hypothetical protein SFV22_00020, partial [Saprospiraceae bacterium]|nr:hypothetical protein [Saprospiraceae bacterium]